MVDILFKTKICKFKLDEFPCSQWGSRDLILRWKKRYIM